MYSQKGDPLKVLKLVAIINGVIKFRFFDLQMFVHLQGVPGAGKGTYARILETVVGKPNYTSAKLHKLGDDNVIAAIIDKQLVVCPDEKKQACDFSGLLSLTGGDNIPYTAKYKPHADGKFYGTIVVVSNSNPFVGDVTGVDRRHCLATFDASLPIRDARIEKQMQAEVPYLSAIALAMSDQQVTDLITGTGDSAIPDFKRQQWLHKTENDSIAMFMEEMLIPTSPDQYVMLGGKGDDRNTLYGAYMALCEENNSKSLFTKNNFRGHLLELCREVGWNDVREARQGNGWRIYGMRLRKSEDTALRISEWLGTECRECKPSVVPIVDLKPLPHKESVESVLLFDGNLSLSDPQINLDLFSEESDKKSGELNQKIDLFPSPSNKNPGELNQKNSQKKEIGSDLVYTPTESIQHKGFEPTLKDNTADTVHTPNTDSVIEQPYILASPSLIEQLMAVWNDVLALGNLVLALSSSELAAVTANYTDVQIKHILDAANSAWRPGLNRDADYHGERVEILQVGQSKEIKIRTANGGIIKVKRGNLRPWLGI